MPRLWPALFVLLASFPARAQPSVRLGGDPDHAASPHRRRRDQRAPVLACATDDGVSLNQTRPDVEQVLRFLERTRVPAVHERLLEFRARLRGGTLRVEPLDEAVRARNGGGDGLMATFEFSPHAASQAIYVDFRAELGVLAVHFYHEMIHALDPELPRFYLEFDRRYVEIGKGIATVKQGVADRLGKPSSEISLSDFTGDDFERLKDAKRFQNDGIYALERKAFEGQMALLNDLFAQIPCYAAYVAEQKALNNINLRYANIPGHLYCAYGLYGPDGRVPPKPPCAGALTGAR
jgi:hypothetical protein